MSDPDRHSRAEMKQVRRLLKLVSNDGPVILMGLSADRATLYSNGRQWSFPRSVFDHVCRGALVEKVGNRISISRDGAQKLKRLLHPEDPYCGQHADIGDALVGDGDDKIKAKVNFGESPLARLFHRKDRRGESWLSHDEFRAGERLRADFEKAGLQPTISASWSIGATRGSNAGGADSISDLAIDAGKRLDQAIEAMGPDLAETAIDVCCFLKGLEAVERERRWPPRSAKLLLRSALRALVRHYGIATGNRTSSIRNWGDGAHIPAVLPRN